MSRTRRKHRPLNALSNRLVFEIAFLYVQQGIGAQEISDMLRANYPQEFEAFHLTNEQIRKVLAIAIDRGILSLVPSREEHCANLLHMKSRTAFSVANPDVEPVHKMINKTIRVMDVAGEIVRPHIEDNAEISAAWSDATGGASEFATAPMVEQIANAAAEEVLALIRLIGDKNNKKRVRIGLGAGHTAQCVVRRLGKLVRLEPDCPPLALHALTPGFSTDPLQSPVTYFRFFENSGDIKYVGLSTAPFVSVKDLAKLQEQPSYAEASELAQEIDIVISSLAQADDEHGMLKRYLEKYYPSTYTRLKEKNWKGDVQFSPYNDEPLELDEGVRAVSLLGLKDLRKMVAAPNKYVLLVAGPCNACGESKTAAIEPLLVRPSLNVWTHMVMDIETAEELTGKLPEHGATTEAAELPAEQDTEHRRRRKGQAVRKKRFTK